MNPNFSMTMNTVLIKARSVGRKLVDGYKGIVQLDNSETSELYKSLGDTLTKKGDGVRAINLLKKAVELNPEDGKIASKLGQAYYKTGEPEKALPLLEKANVLGPTVSNYLYISKIHSDKEDFKKAVDSLETVVKLNPDNAKVHYQLGVNYDKLKNVDKAIEHFKKAIEINPYVPKYHFSLGFLYDSNEKHDEAIKCFKKAIALEKD
ncbi:MAG: tetratricopeptide repeat protein [Fibrobacteria bacterium]|nr:tetratricopeptide repeat protein [Fibrobacteria bacterium]